MYMQSHIHVRATNTTWSIEETCSMQTGKYGGAAGRAAELINEDYMNYYMSITY